MTDSPIPTKLSPRRRRWRTLIFHIAAVVVVLSPLVLAEITLRLCVTAPPPRWDDPYVSFDRQRPLFVLDAAGSRYETASDRLIAFRSQSFAAQKSPGTFRIFALGGSTVQGRPYSVETAFTTWLQMSLQAARPEIDWEVVNAGGISYASYRLLPILRELLAYEPDLFVLYMGHNEFLEDRTYARRKRVPRLLVDIHRALLNLRSYALADSWLAHRRHQQASQTVLSPEVKTKLDMAEGLASYRRDPAGRHNVINHFGRDLEAMVRLAHEANVPIILADPASNLKDCPPFKSAFRNDLSAAQSQRVTELWQQARQRDWSQVDDKIALLEEATAIEARHAWLLFLTGTCYKHIGRFPEAREWFIRAKDEDICPLRILEPMRTIIGDIAHRHQVPLVDVQALIETHTGDGIGGEEWLLDHVHPTIAGHQLIAEALFGTMVEMDLVQDTAHRPAIRERLWQDHLASLNEAYHAQGQARLKRLREWSRGRIHQK